MANNPNSACFVPFQFRMLETVKHFCSNCIKYAKTNFRIAGQDGQHPQLRRRSTAAIQAAEDLLEHVVASELGTRKLFSFATTTTRQCNKASETSKNTKTVKASVYT